MKTIDISKWTRDEWVKNRSEYIGGSDAAGIINKSRYDTPATIAAKKLGIIVVEDNEFMERGRILEKHIIKQFEKENEIRVETPQEMYIHDNGRDGANLDGKIPSEKVIIEVKVIGRHRKKLITNDQVIDEHYYQGQHYLHVTGYDRVIFVYAVYEEIQVHEDETTWFDFKELYLRESPRNEEIIKLMLKEYARFWTIFKSGKPTEQIINSLIVGHEAEKELLPDSLEDAVIELPDDIIENYITLSEQIKQLEENKVNLATKIKAMMEGNKKAVTSTRKVSWVVFDKETVSVKKLAIDHPDLVEKYKYSQHVDSGLRCSNRS